MAISPGNIRRSAEYYCYLLLMSLGAMGAFTSLDLFFFYIFHDFALIPTFLLIGIWGAQNRQFASFQVTIYLMAGSLILLAGLVALVMALPPTARTFDIVDAAGLPHSPIPIASSTSQNIIFLLLLVGFGILVGLFPFHSWAPPGYASAPPAAAMLHAGILKKFALYGMIRIAIPMLHDGFETCLPLILALLAGNFLYAGFVTLAQKELPTMLGFSSIMHMGYLFLGIACWNIIGVTGAVVLMVAHGLSAALLFGLSGEITHRSGENRFAELGGLAKRAPVLAVLFSFASMASMGVPGLANFAGEVMVFFGSFAAAMPADSLRAHRGLRHGHHRHLPAARDQERLLRPDAGTVISRSRRRRVAGGERRRRRSRHDRHRHARGARALRPAHLRLARHRLHALPPHPPRPAERRRCCPS